MPATTAPALCFLSGILVWFATVAMRASDRDGERVQGLSGPRTAAALLISTALALYGLVFLSNAIPDWIGYGLLLLAAATFPGLSLRILPPTAVYLEMVLAGFTFLLT